MDSKNIKDPIIDMVRKGKNSHLARIMLIGFLIFLLQIPIAMIDSVMSERERTRNEAKYEITSKWGQTQTVIGPEIIIPFRKTWTETTAKGETKHHETVNFAHFLPDTLNIDSNIKTDIRYRGIYKIPIYTMKTNFEGVFQKPDLSKWNLNDEDIFWNRAYAVVKISDARSITNQAFINWNNEKLDFLPGTGEETGYTGIHVPLNNKLNGESISYNFEIQMNGSEGAYFAPLGKQSIVKISSNWKDPSFQGLWLPTERKIDPDGKGFNATWDIPFLGRNYPQVWRTENNYSNYVNTSVFGLNLYTAIDHYRMSKRSLKYEFLFLILTFATLWLFEILAGNRIHPLQYLLMGSAMCLFYILELSLSEHMGFVKAYIIASASIVLLNFFYSKSVLKSFSKATVAGTVLTLLYGYLYILLKSQDYALLIGSVGLFFILAIIMYLTRNIDWYDNG